MQYIKFLFLLLYCNYSFGQISKLPKFLTKQSLEYLRFIDKSGKFTYYQSSTGSLNLTSNYDNNVLYEAKKGAHYLVTSIANSNLVTIELIEKYHNDLNLNKNHTIFYSKIGDNKITKTAKGKSATIALNDKWLGYYDAKKKTVNFKNLSNNLVQSVKLLNSINNYFVPQMDMLNPETIIYTDINKESHMALLAFNTTDKKFRPIYKSKFAGSKIEFCQLKESLIIGDFSIDDSDHGSTIIQVPIYNNKDYMQQKIIYRSQQADLGNIVCDEDNIYFIKTIEFNSKLNMKTTEVAKLGIKTNDIKILSDIGNATQIIQMGERVLLPYRDTFYIIKGDYDTTKQDQLGKE